MTSRPWSSINQCNPSVNQKAVLLASESLVARDREASACESLCTADARFSCLVEPCLYWLKKRHDRVDVIGLAINRANETPQFMILPSAASPAPSPVAAPIRTCHPQAPNKVSNIGNRGRKALNQKTIAKNLASQGLLAFQKQPTPPSRIRHGFSAAAGLAWPNAERRPWRGLLMAPQLARQTHVPLSWPRLRGRLGSARQSQHAMAGGSGTSSLCRLICLSPDALSYLYISPQDTLPNQTFASIRGEPWLGEGEGDPICSSGARKTNGACPGEI